MNYETLKLGIDQVFFKGKCEVRGIDL